ncbi:MAG: hypothetical protein KGI83_05525, partial [Verrucomicrobiota bacterium]|nr:hypothetical protein [Verrucomicrobiota bacterium]
MTASIKGTSNPNFNTQSATSATNWGTRQIRQLFGSAATTAQGLLSALFQSIAAAVHSLGLITFRNTASPTSASKEEQRVGVKPEATRPAAAPAPSSVAAPASPQALQLTKTDVALAAVNATLVTAPMLSAAAAPIVAPIAVAVSIGTTLKNYLALPQKASLTRKAMTALPALGSVAAQTIFSSSPIMRVIAQGPSLYSATKNAGSKFVGAARELSKHPIDATKAAIVHGINLAAPWHRAYPLLSNLSKYAQYGQNDSSSTAEQGTCDIDDDKTCHVDDDKTCHVDDDKTCHVDDDKTCPANTPSQSQYACAPFEEKRTSGLSHATCRADEHAFTTSQYACKLFEENRTSGLSQATSRADEHVFPSNTAQGNQKFSITQPMYNLTARPDNGMCPRPLPTSCHADEHAQHVDSGATCPANTPSQSQYACAPFEGQRTSELNQASHRADEHVFSSNTAQENQNFSITPPMCNLTDRPDNGMCPSPLQISSRADEHAADATHELPATTSTPSHPLKATTTPRQRIIPLLDATWLPQRPRQPSLIPQTRKITSKYPHISPIPLEPRQPRRNELGSAFKEKATYVGSAFKEKATNIGSAFKEKATYVGSAFNHILSSMPSIRNFSPSNTAQGNQKFSTTQPMYNLTARPDNEMCPRPLQTSTPPYILNVPRIGSAFNHILSGMPSIRNFSPSNTAQGNQKFSTTQPMYNLTARPDNAMCPRPLQTSTPPYMLSEPVTHVIRSSF